MRYVGRLFRPPSEAHSYILQATVGCSWNKCTYCDMYRDKEFQQRPLAELLNDLDTAAQHAGPWIEKVFVADGDALVMPVSDWLPILERCKERFPRLRQISCYATAMNLAAKTDQDLAQLRQAGLNLLYIGPESGDDVTLKRIAKGTDAAAHAEAAARAHLAGMAISAIFLLGAGGKDRSHEHAIASAELASKMDPEYLAALTLTVIPGTPMATAMANGQFQLPGVRALLRELRTFVDLARPSGALFRTNHASNHLALGGRLPDDRERIVAQLDEAMAGQTPLRPDQLRGL